MTTDPLQNENQQAASSRKPGRPPIAGETADAQIQLRTTLARKNAYVKAAKPQKLTAWIFHHLDRAAGYTP